ncbi:MAG TPA: alpha/beta hydrolase-fold protein [Polyangia bacterium]|jgi:predicted alpha/beta superfamily hydrolase
MRDARLGLLAAALALLFALGCGSGSAAVPDGGAGDAAPAADAARADAPRLDAAPADGPVATTDLARLRALVAALPGASGAAARDALVDAFVTVVAYGEHGFPIREEGQLGVALRDSGGGSLTVAGDFNGWDAAALPLIQPVPGYPFYYRITPITEPLPRTLYKLVRNGAEWFADPLARRFGWDANGQYALAEAGDAASHLERWPRFAEGVGALEPRTVTVYVPAGYVADATPRPVLYMHDGQNLFDPAAFWGGWHVGDTADAHIAGGQIQSLLIVGVDNTAARFDEYTHVQDDLTGTTTGGRGDEYLDFIVTGVKPFVDARYRTATGPATTGVLGSSLGGLISFYAAYLHPEVFGHAASMSGTFVWGRGLGNPTMMDLVAADPPTGVALYLDSGGDPPCPTTAESNDNYCETIEMADTLRGQGWADGTDLFYRWTSGAQHNEAAWAARLPAALTEWFPGP